MALSGSALFSGICIYYKIIQPYNKTLRLIGTNLL